MRRRFISLALSRRCILLTSFRWGASPCFSDRFKSNGSHGSPGSQHLEHPTSTRCRNFDLPSRPIQFSMATIAEPVVENVHAPDPPGTNPFAKLKENFNKYRSEKFLKETERYEPLKKGQWPRFIIITCMDTRVAPEVLLGIQPGEAIVIRNVANLVPPYSTEKEGNQTPSVGSGLEYAVKVLKAQYIVVTGHHSCGGIIHLLNSDGAKKQSFEFVEKWIKISEDAHTKTIDSLGEEATFDAKHDALARESVNNSLKNLLTYPFIQEAIKERDLRIFGAYYDIVDGVYEHWDFVDGKVGPTQTL